MTITEIVLLSQEADGALLANVLREFNPLLKKITVVPDKAALDALPLDAVVQFHVAGHFTLDDGLRVDTHGERVCEDVYALLEHALARTGPRPVLLERDQNFPPWPELVAEIRRLDAIYRRATGETA